MARARRKPRARKSPKPVSAWERRNEKARSLGYRNYYDYRVHDYGKRPPSEAVQKGKRARQSGARGPTAFKRALKKPDKLALIVEAPRKRGQSGEWTQIAFIAMTVDGDIREYYIDVDSKAAIDEWHSLIDDSGVDFLEYGSLDIEGAKKKAARPKRSKHYRTTRKRAA